MKKFQKNKKGITLVALVITIIILLILAGISIATLTGSGLFEKAILAEQKSKNAQELENVILRDYENNVDMYLNGTNRDTEEISYEWNDLKIQKKNEEEYSYYYNEKEIYPLYWYGYISNTISVLDSKSTSTTGTILGQRNIKEELTEFLRLRETTQYKSTYYKLNDTLDYSKFSKMKVKIKSYSSGWLKNSVFSFGFLGNTSNDWIKKMSLSGKNNTYSTKPEIILTGEYTLDISDIDFSDLNDYIPVISFYKEEQDTSANVYIDIEAIWFE